MKNNKWTVTLSGKARKNVKKIPVVVVETLQLLVKELKSGPDAYSWPNYGKLNKYSYHCHLKKGRPTYVACWTAEKKNKSVEVYYVGTHEKAPY